MACLFDIRSTNTSKSGWTQTGSYWNQIGSGTHYYASYPSGFDTSNSLCDKYNKSSISAYENSTNKREISNVQHYVKYREK